MDGGTAEEYSNIYRPGVTQKTSYKQLFSHGMLKG